MKTEHRDIIDRARLADMPPSYIAHELLVHDLVNMVLFEVKNIHSPWSKLNEGCQQEVIDRAVKSATEAAHTAINIISSRNVDVVEVKVIDAKFKEKAITITANIDVNDPNGGALAKVPGKMCLLVVAPTDYDEGLDFIQPDRDQKDLPLHVSDLTGSLFPAGGDDLASYDDTVPDGEDPLYSDAVVFVIESRRPSVSAIQRKLKIGYNRAARMLEGMEQTGIVSAMNTNGTREVLRPVLTTPTGPDEHDNEHPLGSADDLAERTNSGVTRPAPEVEVGKEFGEFDYDDAAQLIVLKADRGRFEAAWVQSRLAIDSDKATTLLLRLLDNGVIELETEGATALEHSYKVVATLADVT